MTPLWNLVLLASYAFSGPIAPRQTCQGQSCTLAALSGSSGQPFDPTVAPTGGSDSGDCCIISYNPAVAAQLYAYNPNLQSECASSSSSSSAAGVRKRDWSIMAHNTRRQSTPCLPYTLIYAVGTFETPPLGMTVGPALSGGLQAAQPNDWSIQGVNYNSSLDGDYCLGLPGGAIGAQLIDQVAADCPDTKIVVAGYSQGAMVAHNAVANAAQSCRVDGVVVFGDPFDGAPIKGYAGPIQTYCATGDEVCDGEFNISAAHLSYVGADTEAAVTYIVDLVSS